MRKTKPPSRARFPHLRNNQPNNSENRKRHNSFVAFSVEIALIGAITREMNSATRAQSLQLRAARCIRSLVFISARFFSASRQTLRRGSNAWPSIIGAKKSRPRTRRSPADAAARMHMYAFYDRKRIARARARLKFYPFYNCLTVFSCVARLAIDQEI